MRPMVDRQYQGLPFQLNERPHKYGHQVHLISDPFLLSRLARLCSPSCVQPEINRLVAGIYTSLAQHVANRELPRKSVEIPTRMSTEHKEGVYVGEVLDPETPVVLVDLARAGMLPAIALFEMFSSALQPSCARIDHIFINRSLDENKQVIGAAIHGSKVGGSIEGATVIVPDPMGATGGSMSNMIQFYQSTVAGKARKWISLNLIITPEYIRKLTREHPDLLIYALRLDRGFSSKRALDSLPGEYPDEEGGLNEHQYIVPGGGGFGELSSNAFV